MKAKSRFQIPKSQTELLQAREEFRFQNPDSNEPAKCEKEGLRGRIQNKDFLLPDSEGEHRFRSDSRFREFGVRARSAGNYEGRILITDSPNKTGLFITRYYTAGTKQRL